MVTRWELLRWTATSKTNEVITQVGIQPGWAVLRCVNTSGELQVEGGGAASSFLLLKRTERD